MGFIKWQEEFQTGHTEVDEQHRKLLNTLNDIHFLINTRIDFRKLKEIIFFLNDYIIEHFGTEEKLMQESSGLPKALHKLHLKEHRFFIDKIQEFSSFLEIQEPFDEGDQKKQQDIFTYASKLFEFLGRWFAHHILEIDKKTMRYILAQPTGQPESSKWV